MPQVHVTDRSGNEVCIEAESGRSLMEAIRDAGIDELEALCGGSLACATCHVFVRKDWLNKLPEMKSEEQDLVSFSEHYTEQSRLSCQVNVDTALEGLAVRIAPED